jgi:T4 RnlA family RNA ligase
MSSPDSLPSYEQCVTWCGQEDSPFYEIKTFLDGYQVSMFNYRLATYSDFIDKGKKELRGLTFVFNLDGSLYQRYLLLEKFFNLNQTPESMYSVVKDYKVKFVNNKEDGSIASFIRLPNGKAYGKSKMAFISDQAIAINRIYHNNPNIRIFVDWCLDNNIVAVFEYVSPMNRIVLKYKKEELILLRLRDNNTGKHIDIKEYLSKLNGLKIAPSKEDSLDLDELIELTAEQTECEGWVVHTEDVFGGDFFFKLKTPWYVERHRLLTEYVTRENQIVHLILDEKIDDLLGQIPEDEKDTHERINRIITIVRTQFNKKVADIEHDYQIFVDMDFNKKDYALKYGKTLNFHFVMLVAKGSSIEEVVKKYIKDQTKQLMMARKWLISFDENIHFVGLEEENYL